mgnify:CR=1 FL=1
MYIVYIIVFLLILTSLILIYLRYINKFNCTCNMNRSIRIKEKSLLADKLKVKKYIIENFPYVKISNTYYSTKNFKDLLNFDYNSLPDKFVVKVNNSASNNGVLIISDKNKFRKENLYKIQSMYVHGNWPLLSYLVGEEKHYEQIEETYFIEEYLGSNLNEYKFLVINGKIVFTTVDYNRFGEDEHCKNIYDENFQLYKDKYWGVKTCKFVDEKPKNFELMKKFCLDFYQKTKIQFVRIDLYSINDDVYFSEFTFTPHNCMSFNNLF